jgi:hypothetical protein
MKAATISTTPPKKDTAQDYTGVRLSDLMDKIRLQQLSLLLWYLP